MVHPLLCRLASEHVPYFVCFGTKPQCMEHSMRQSEATKDGPFYEAKTKQQRMDHFMKQTLCFGFASGGLTRAAKLKVAGPQAAKLRNGVEEVLDSRSAFYSPRGERCTFFPPLCIELLCGPRTYDLGPNRDAGTQPVTSTQPPKTPNRQRRCPS